MLYQPITTTTLLLLCLLLATPVAAEDSEASARRLINALGCKGCHSFEGDGGSLAPALDQVGNRKTREEIIKHLAAHEETRKSSIMPSFSTTPQDALKILSDFLYKH